MGNLREYSRADSRNPGQAASRPQVEQPEGRWRTNGDKSSRVVDHCMSTSKQQEPETEKNGLEDGLRNPEQEVVKQEQTVKDLRNENVELKQKVARVEAHIFQLKSVILGNVGTQKTFDDEVVGAFSQLRQLTQQVAASSAFDLSVIPQPVLDSKNQEKTDFYSSLGQTTASPKDFGLRLRAEIFSLLEHLIFSRTCFGLKQGGGEGNRELWDMEDWLNKFEKLLLGNPKVQRCKVTDWRIVTLECVDMLRIPETYGILVAREIDGFFHPIRSKHATRAQHEELSRKISITCQRAVELAKMMQQSNRGYEVRNINIEQYPLLSSLEHCAEALGVENGKISERSDALAYVLFGMLTRTSPRIDGEGKILVKAEVILKKIPTYVLGRGLGNL
ncbi:hypothetical protein CC80DRAFT_530791 [Byssothecium circinans]|uniref:Uncharacterized protein n=1 Tax=Byssothecium circinans TaxID=147558 RepID=A0A6A5UJ02_9PLEO|nr:hypothetical protein CC80DRAFT_530791 [Byssothecium circinans]